MIAAQLFKPADSAGFPAKTSSSFIEGSEEVSQGIEFYELIDDTGFTLESPLSFVQEMLSENDENPARQLPASAGKDLPLSADSVIPGLLPIPTTANPQQALKNPDNVLEHSQASLAVSPRLVLREAAKVTATPVETKNEGEEIKPVLDTRLVKGAGALQEPGENLKLDSARPVLDFVKLEGVKQEASKESPYQPHLNMVTKTEAIEPARKPEAPARLSINTPVQHHDWSDGFAGRISWMLNNNQHTARINVHPAELGPIEVKIQLHNEQANVNFVAGNQATREAILEAFPRLREMLDEHGLNLHQGSVSDNTAEQGRQQHGDVETETSHAPASNFHEPGDEVEIHTSLQEPGLVDHFV